jgi:hypothetical protein
LQTTPIAQVELVLAGVTACDTELASLQEVVDTRFNTVSGAPVTDPLTFVVLKETFETARWVLERSLKKRKQEQPAREGPRRQAAGAAEDVVRTPEVSLPHVSAGVGVQGDRLWIEALTLIRGSRVDGLQLMQSQLGAARCGRDRFLCQLQLAELALEAGVYSLAFPVFDDLARTIDGRKLEEWEDRELIARVWQGLARCCALLKQHDASCGPRETEILDRLARLASSAPAASS